MKPIDYLRAARVPRSLQPQIFVPWRIDRTFLMPERRDGTRFRSFTVLRHLVPMDMSNMHLADNTGNVMEVVMEDTPRELRRHMPIWMAARDDILITGLGLGCVVRGLLASPKVRHIDVVEIDAAILRIIGKEFANNPRVTLHHGDALTIEFPKDKRWDYAWHDLWMEKPGLQSLHAKLMMRFRPQVKHQQGAWAFPPAMKKHWSRYYPLLGAPKVRRAA